jgi:hypothetical protein
MGLVRVAHIVGRQGFESCSLPVAADARRWHKNVVAFVNVLPMVLDGVTPPLPLFPGGAAR